MAAFTQTAETPPMGGCPASVGLIPLAAYTATGHCEFSVPFGARVVEIEYSQTAGTSGQSIVFTLDGFNEMTQTWDALISTVALTSATTDNAIVQVNPMTPPVTNGSAQNVPRRRMRATVTHADSKSVTYAVAAHVA